MPPVGVLNSRWPRAGPGRALSRAGSETLGEGTGHRLHPTELGGRTGSRANFLGHGGGGGGDSQLKSHLPQLTHRLTRTCPRARGPAGPGQAPQNTCQQHGPHEACSIKGSEHGGRAGGKWAKTAASGKGSRRTATRFVNCGEEGQAPTPKGDSSGVGEQLCPLRFPHGGEGSRGPGAQGTSGLAPVGTAPPAAQGPPFQTCRWECLWQVLPRGPHCFLRNVKTRCSLTDSKDARNSSFHFRAKPCAKHFPYRPIYTSQQMSVREVPPAPDWQRGGRTRPSRVCGMSAPLLCVLWPPLGLEDPSETGRGGPGGHSCPPTGAQVSGRQDDLCRGWLPSRAPSRPRTQGHQPRSRGSQQAPRERRNWGLRACSCSRSRAVSRAPAIPARTPDRAQLGQGCPWLEPIWSRQGGKWGPAAPAASPPADPCPESPDLPLTCPSFHPASPKGVQAPAS